MKMIRNIIAGGFVLAVIGFNIVRSDRFTSENGVLSNVKALQASAGEAWCDDTSKNPCSISVPNGPTVTGVGQSHAKW